MKTHKILIRSLELALACCLRLLLSLDAGLLVMFTLSDLLQYSCIRTAPLETAECVVQRFVFLYCNTRHSLSLPSAADFKAYRAGFRHFFRHKGHYSINNASVNSDFSLCTPLSISITIFLSIFKLLLCIFFKTVIIGIVF